MVARSSVAVESGGRYFAGPVKTVEDYRAARAREDEAHRWRETCRLLVQRFAELFMPSPDEELEVLAQIDRHLGQKPDLVGHDWYPDMRAEMIVDNDLDGCIRNAGIRLSAPIARVLLELTGQNDGPAWHWICRLDYTGWFCHSSGEAFEANDLEGVLRLVDEDTRGRFTDMIGHRIRRRDNPGSWA